MLTSEARNSIALVRALCQVLDGLDYALAAAAAAAALRQTLEGLF